MNLKILIGGRDYIFSNFTGTYVIDLINMISLLS